MQYDFCVLWFCGLWLYHVVQGKARLLGRGPFCCMTLMLMMLVLLPIPPRVLLLSDQAYYLCSWIYRIWIHRSKPFIPDFIRQRLAVVNLWKDCISGMIIATFIIFSFLSLVRVPHGLLHHTYICDQSLYKFASSHACLVVQGI